MTTNAVSSPQNQTQDTGWQTLAEFSVPSVPGHERRAADQVVEAIQGLRLPALRLERLSMAVAEAVLNAIEHGNQNRAELPVNVLVKMSAQQLLVRISDQGQSGPIPTTPEPDLAAKVAGRQPPRGWGLFLIEKLVDEVRFSHDGSQSTVELLLNLANS